MTLRLLSGSHDTGSITSADSTDGSGNHFGSLLLPSTCEIFCFSQSPLSTYSVTSVSNNKRDTAELGGRRMEREEGWGRFWDMEILVHSLSGSSKRVSSHISCHPPPQHLPRDQDRDRWSLGDRRAVKHKQSGYQILPSTAATQLDIRIHSHLTATPAPDPVTYHTSDTHTQSLTYYKL